MIIIDQSRCVRCGSCMSVCSMGMFRQEEDGSVQVKDRACMECYHCAAVCPAQAIGTDAVSPDALCAPLPDDPLRSAIQTRRSIRRFGEELPERAFLQSVLDTAMYAPSGKNEHANRWTAVLGRSRTDALYQMTLDWAKDVPHYRHLIKLAQWGRNPVTCGAPCILVGWNRTDALNPQTDTVIALTLAEQLLVRAGWGTCWGGYLRAAAQDSPVIRQALGVPEGCQVYELLLVGRPLGPAFRRLPPRPAAQVTWLD